MSARPGDARSGRGADRLPDHPRPPHRTTSSPAHRADHSPDHPHHRATGSPDHSHHRATRSPDHRTTSSPAHSPDHPHHRTTRSQEGR
ncbi:hypothetical protein [Saccharothrix syringae]|uniref:Uncharacterized protein n=1 Tax=Saccharothrix syringae TaxID=103733 RepID=A0A5Q0H712_SACSY|nr:hypothetical protein [Saccharothrix syringae]QFZ21502.1 hypothetical protein EKG83_32590 [Saccharothrix syringae]